MKPNDSKNKDDITQEQVSSSDAMDEYFFDMLGSVADQQPLKKYDADEVTTVSQTREQKLLSNTENLTKPAVQLKPKTKVIAKAEFAEPERAKISPLIIPAAFPKLAPVKVEAKPEVSLKQATKLDRKTALEILEKKKSQLSAKQLQRLEEKLGVKTKTGTVKKVENKAPAKIETKVEVKPQEKTNTVKASTVAKPKRKEQVKAKVELKPEIKEMIPGEPGQFGPPEWAQDRFECLIFSVAGLKLAVPLVSLGAIYKMEQELTPIVGRAKYFMGLYRHQDRNVRVVDTAQWVMPDRWTEDARDGYHFIIRLGGNNWGLACDSVHESIQLESDMVKWRTERTSRAWLSGTVIGHMCALLDADVLSLMLEETGESNRIVFN